MDGRTIAAWIFFVIAVGIWGIFFAMGAFISFVERPSGLAGIAGPIYMFMLAPVGVLPALIGALLGKKRSRASNLIALLVILCIEAAVLTQF